MKTLNQRLKSLGIVGTLVGLLLGATSCGQQETEASKTDSFHAQRGWFRKTNLYLLPYARVAQERPLVSGNDLTSLLNAFHMSTEQCWYYVESRESFDLSTSAGQVKAFEESLKLGGGGYISSYELFENIRIDPALRALHSRYVDIGQTIVRAIVGGTTGAIGGVTIVSGAAAVLTGIGATALVTAGGTTLGLAMITSTSTIGLMGVGISALCGPLFLACAVGAAAGTVAVVGGSGYSAAHSVMTSPNERINDPVRVARLKAALKDVSKTSKVSAKEMDRLVSLISGLSDVSDGSECPSQGQIILEIKKNEAARRNPQTAPNVPGLRPQSMGPVIPANRAPRMTSP